MHIALLDGPHPELKARLLQAGHAVHETALAEDLSTVQGLILRSTRVDAVLLAELPRLRMVGRLGSGMENIDRVACTERNIEVYNTPEGNRDGVGELCVAQLLVLLRHVVRANAQVHQGVWDREQNRGYDLQGRTIGIIGYGHMGSAFAEKLSGFGVRIVAHDKYVRGFGRGHVEEATLEEVLGQSEVISLHLPLDAHTHHFANASFFSRLAKPVWFLNTSRGPVVHTAALLDALDAGRVRGAALDVLEFEKSDLRGLDDTIDPATLERLRAHERVLLTPHVAGVTHEGRYKMAMAMADKVLAFAAREGL
jgi:D-3-phosphoglycerate dehydrogenase / 2-oxoglutarate reductase